jgi:hypothetical protein
MGEVVTVARWCNHGAHSFDGARTDTIIIGKMVQVPNQWGGQQPHTEPNLKEICGDCAALLGITTDYEAPPSPEERHKEIRKELGS